MPSEQRSAADAIMRNIDGRVRQILHDWFGATFGHSWKGGKLDGGAVLAATPTGLGVVEPDNATIVVDANGVITASPLASTAVQAGTVGVTISSGGASGTATVTFATPYTAVPVVVVSSANGDLIASWSSVTPTTFVATLTAAANVLTDTTATVSYMAAGNSATQAGGRANGVDSYVLMASDIAFGSGAFSVGGWCITTMTGAGTLWQSGYLLPAQNIMDVYLTSGVLKTDTRDSSTDHVLTASAVNDGLPHHWAFTRSGTTIKLYLDGALAASGTGPSGSVSGAGASTKMGYGAGATDGYFKGILWGVRAYVGTALSGAQVTAWYGGTPPAGATNAWNFDEGSGATVADSIDSDPGTWQGTAPYWS